jgi:hypothetical protein
LHPKPKSTTAATKRPVPEITTKSPLLHTEIYAEVQMRRSDYWKRASKRFLAGSRFKIPCEAVEAGTRTLEEWTRMLREEREIELAWRDAHAKPRPHKKHQIANPA